MMWMNRRIRGSGIVVELTGGLGNQLFGFAAGFALSRRLGVPLWLDTQKVGRGALREFALTNLISETVQVLKPGSAIRGEVFQESGFHFDNRWAQISHPVRLRGYFQSWRYTQECADDLRRYLVERIAPVGMTAEPRITVHVRRGDYLVSPHREYHGLVTPAYLHSATELVRSLTGIHSCLVFSDDEEQAQEVATLLGASEVEPKTSTPMETLAWMRLGGGFVISNSSLSWWGAYLSEDPSAIVVAPRPWFKAQGLDTRDLLPSRWLTLGNSDAFPDEP
jgi:hypothetical protein